MVMAMKNWGDVIARARTQGTKATIPKYADLLCAFANTLDVDADANPADALPDAAVLTGWLRDRDLLGAEELADSLDHEVAITLRSGLRTAMLHHAEGRTRTIPELDAAAAALPIRVAFSGARSRLIPAVGGAQGGLSHLLIAITQANADNTWERLKLCVADDCLLGFYDVSNNRSRHWCSMGECGNRMKIRRYRARQSHEE
jgi:predicted RNA-binding Zn ribbon-like protein